MHAKLSDHSIAPQTHLCILNQSSLQTLRILNVYGLDIAIQLMRSTLLVVSLSRDSDTQSVRNTLDTSLPDLLVQLRIETNVGCALERRPLVFCSPANPASCFESSCPYH
jgi:hypothetical protein